MPIYEYKCPDHGKFEKLQPLRKRKNVEYRCYCPAPRCRVLAQPVISPVSWHMGWKFLKAKSEKSVAAPSGSQYEPAWDQAYRP